MIKHVQGGTTAHPKIFGKDLSAQSLQDAPFQRKGHRRFDQYAHVLTAFGIQCIMWPLRN
jgi:hypothetical protein